MEFSEVVAKRHACRAYEPRDVEKELLYKIVGEAMNAPSAKNTQPWEFYVTYEAEENAKIRECLQDGGKHAFLNGAAAFIAIFEDTPDNIACEKIRKRQVCEVRCRRSCGISHALRQKRWVG